MNSSELRRKIEQARPESRFFSRNNMKFAGDTMANFGVRSANIMAINYDTTPPSDKEIEVWELYRKRPTRRALFGSFYFRKDTYEQTYGKPIWAKSS